IPMRRRNPDLIELTHRRGGGFGFVKRVDLRVLVAEIKAPLLRYQTRLPGNGGLVIDVVPKDSLLALEGRSERAPKGAQIVSNFVVNKIVICAPLRGTLVINEPGDKCDNIKLPAYLKHLIKFFDAPWVQVGSLFVE